MQVTNDSRPAWSAEEEDKVELPLLALMKRLDEINPLWIRLTLTRDADGCTHLVLCDKADVGYCFGANEKKD